MVEHVSVRAVVEGVPGLRPARRDHGQFLEADRGGAEFQLFTAFTPGPKLLSLSAYAGATKARAAVDSAASFMIRGKWPWTLEGCRRQSQPENQRDDHEKHKEGADYCLTKLPFTFAGKHGVVAFVGELDRGGCFVGQDGTRIPD